MSERDDLGARALIAEIELDLSDRSGLGDEWDNIDPDVKSEILSAWTAIATRERDEAREWRAHYEVAHMRVTAELETVKADCRAMARIIDYGLRCCGEDVDEDDGEHVPGCLAMKYAPKETGE